MARKVLLLLVLVFVAGCDRSSKPEPKAAADAPVAAAAATPGALLTFGTGPTLASEAEQNAAHRCAEDWQNEAYYRGTSRRHTAQERARGRRGVPDDVRRTRDLNVEADFMPRCERFGFTWPTFLASNAAAEAANSSLATQLETQVLQLRSAAERAWREAQDKEGARDNCDFHLAQIARQRQEAQSLAPAEREAVERSLAETAQHFHRMCP